MLDLISIGDAMIDTFIQIHDAEVRCDLNKEQCKICFNYGDKIPVDSLVHSIGGNAANNAVGASRLKLKTALYINIGADLTGQEISRRLKNEGVDARYVVKNTGNESSLSTIVNFQGERTIFVYHQPWKYKLPELDRTRWLYFTSLSKSFVESGIVNEVVRFVERSGVKLMYNPGTSQLRFGVKKNPQLLALTEVLIVNKEEAEKILGEKEETPVKKLLKGLADLGPKMVVITDGVRGSFGFDGEKYLKLESFPAHLVEMTGAGDAYATGVLAALFHRFDLKEAMRWGAANGASVVEQIGAQDGLLTYGGMIERLKVNSQITAKEI